MTRNATTVFFSVLLFILAPAFPVGAQNVYRTAEDYLKTLDGQSVQAIEGKVDRLIGASGDSTSMAKTAAFCYERYLRSQIMGYEAVSLHIADKYFISHKLSWPVEGGLTMVELFAEFNRNSMIGCRAPSLLADDSRSQMQSIPGQQSDYKVLYFYDTDCKQCKVQTPLLKQFLKSTGTALTFYAFNTQADSSAWLSAAASFDSCSSPKVTVVNVWDPSDSSDYQRLYGVLSTPQTYLIDRRNTIVGRRLDAKSLEFLLATQIDREKQDEDFFAKYFSTLGEMEDEGMKEAVDAFYPRTESDSSLFCSTYYSLYRYLKSRKDYSLQKGAAYLAETYIVGKPEMWPQDIVQQCSEAVNLFNRNPLGEPAQDLFLQDSRGRSVNLLKGNAKHTVIYFYSPDCPVCEASTADIKAMSSLLHKKGVRVVAVYTGTDGLRFKKNCRKLPLSWTKLWDGGHYSQMHDKYNLTAVPAIYLLDKDKNVVAKEINPINLKKLIEEL
jgi:peroxiredoxin